MKRLPEMAAVLLICAAAHSQAPSSPAPDAADVRVAEHYVVEASKDLSHCRRPSACDIYFDTFGVAIQFADGSVGAFSHVQRRAATPRDCIKSARTYLQQGDRSLAVQWVMAAWIENERKRDWLGSHPDAVMAALRQRR